MIKHVGRHNNKKCIILYKTVPNEDHMCLILYSDTLPRNYHDGIMSLLESDVGQQAKEFSDALFRRTFNDGRNMLQTLHAEGLIKKVPNGQVIVTPNAKSQIRLDELNGILAQLAGGAEGAQKLADLDANAGLVSPAQRRAKGTVNNTTLSENLRLQSERLRNEAQRMIDESEKLLKQSAALTEDIHQLLHGDTVDEEPVVVKKTRGRKPKVKLDA
jgi:hypothetical protein